MRNPINKVCIFGALILAASFWSCSTDSDVVAIGEDEYNGIHIVDDSVLGDNSNQADEDGDEVKSSSSKKKEEAKSSSSSKKKEASSSSKPASSSAKKDSSSSTKDSTDTTVSSSSKQDSSATKPASSSSVKESSSSKKEEASSDSEAEAKSSSSKKNPHIPGIEDPDENEVTSSSSSSEKAEIPPAPESSSSSKQKPNSSDATVVDESQRDSTMDKLTDEEKDLLDSLINSGDTSLTQIDSVVNHDTLDFDNNEYLCKAPDGNWYRLNENKTKTFWKKFWDLVVLILTGHHYYDYTQVCDEIYMRPKG